MYDVESHTGGSELKNEVVMGWINPDFDTLNSRIITFIPKNLIF